MSAAASAMERLATLSVDDFAPCVGDVFRRVDVGGELVLEEAEGRGGSGPRPAFALVFRGPVESRPTQRLHALAHATLGRLDVFLVPIAADADGTRYEAVFA